MAKIVTVADVYCSYYYLSFSDAIGKYDVITVEAYYSTKLINTVIDGGAQINVDNFYQKSVQSFDYIVNAHGTQEITLKNFYSVNDYICQTGILTIGIRNSNDGYASVALLVSSKSNNMNIISKIGDEYLTASSLFSKNNNKITITNPADVDMQILVNFINQ